MVVFYFVLAQTDLDDVDCGLDRLPDEGEHEEVDQDGEAVVNVRRLHHKNPGPVQVSGFPFLD